MNKKIKRSLLAVGLAVTVAAGVGACGGSSPAKASVQACTKAYPAWFAASAAAQRTTATPDQCKGLSQDQIAAIAATYLSSQN
jgi:hypothetical protein